MILLPVAGGLIVALIARFGSEKIHDYGISETIEAILFGKSKMSTKVTALKTLSSGLLIGGGGLFGAEGPIIMAGGTIGWLIAQYFYLAGAERKTLSVASAVAGMTAVFCTPIAAVLLAVELLLFELRPRSLLPVIVACAVAGFTRPLLLDAGPLLPMQTLIVGIIGIIALFFCVVVGILGGADVDRLIPREDLSEKLPIHWIW